MTPLSYCQCMSWSIIFSLKAQKQAVTKEGWIVLVIIYYCKTVSQSVKFVSATFELFFNYMLQFYLHDF